MAGLANIWAVYNCSAKASFTIPICLSVSFSLRECLLDKGSAVFSPLKIPNIEVKKSQQWKVGGRGGYKLFVCHGARQAQTTETDILIGPFNADHRA